MLLLIVSVKVRFSTPVLRSKLNSVSIAPVVSSIIFTDRAAESFLPVALLLKKSNTTPSLTEIKVFSELVPNSVLLKISFKSSNERLMLAVTPFGDAVTIPSVRVTKSVMFSVKFILFCMDILLKSRVVVLITSSKVKFKLPVFKSSTADSNSGGVRSGVYISTCKALPSVIGKTSSP